MFVGIVKIEKNAEILADKPDVAIYSARVSYRTRQSYRYVKEGQSNNTNRQFMEATFFVNKRPSKDDENVTTQAFSDKDLVLGTVIFVEEGDIGVDEIEKEAGKKQWFTKLKISRAQIVTKGTETSENDDSIPFKINDKKVPVPAKTPPAKAPVISPRKVKDPVDSVPSLPPVAGWNS